MKGKFKRPNQKILNDSGINDCLRKLHKDFVLVPPDKAANNIIVTCKKYYIETLIKELGINSSNQINSTYVPSIDSYDKILKSHSDFVNSMGLKLSEEDQDLPYLYWTPRLHKAPFKQCFVTGSSKSTTKELSCLLTKILTTIKHGLSRYCNTKMSHNGVNNMWILKNSTSLLSSLEKLDVRYAKSVQTFDFSILYTSIPHDLLMSRISTLIRNSFKKKDGSIRYKYIKVDGRRGYFSNSVDSGGDKTYNANQMCHMVEFLIDNIFVKSEGHLFRQVIGSPMGTNCAPSLLTSFFYSYESDFLDNMIRSGHRKLARSFNSMFSIYR